jgi:prophage regulatory protein
MPLTCSTKASLGESLRFLMVVNKASQKQLIRSTGMNTQRILRKKEILHMTGVSSATLYRLISKGAFSLSKKLTCDSGRVVGGLKSDIYNRVNSRMQAGE